MFAKKKDIVPAPAFTPLAQMQPAPTACTPTAAVAPTPPPRPKPASMIAQGVAIKGDVVGDGELHLDCVLQGDIRVGKLVLGPNARVEGAIQAHVVEVHGRLTGSISAKQVRLYGASQVDGDITHEQLAMETGAQFQGRSLRFQRPAPAQPAPVAQPVPGPAPAMAI